METGRNGDARRRRCARGTARWTLAKMRVPNAPRARGMLRCTPDKTWMPTAAGARGARQGGCWPKRGCPASPPARGACLSCATACPHRSLRTLQFGSCCCRSAWVRECRTASGRRPVCWRLPPKLFDCLSYPGAAQTGSPNPLGEALADAVDGLLGIGRQGLDLGRDHSEAAARLTGPRRLNRGIERDEVD